MSKPKDEFREFLERSKKLAKEIEPKPCPKHGKKLANNCDECLHYVGDWFAHGYLTQNIEAHESWADSLDAFKELLKGKKGEKKANTIDELEARMKRNAKR